MKTHDSQKPTPRGDSLHFVLLIPHRDMVGPLRIQSRFLFAAGLCGAWSFPQAAPLALVKRPFNTEQLQSLASDLRSLALRAEVLTALATSPAKGTFSLGPPALVPCPGFHGFFGPILDLPSPPLPYPGVLYPFPNLVLCTALAAPGDEQLLGSIHDIPPLSPAFFRAAMVANLAIKPLSGVFSPETLPESAERCAYPAKNYSFTWRIGKPQWLPSPRKTFPKDNS